MKNATPSKGHPVKTVLKLLEDLSAEIITSFTSRKAYDKRPVEYFLEKFQKVKDRTIRLYESHFFDEKGLERIEQDIFTPLDTANDVDFSLLLSSFDKLKLILEKKISKDEKIKGVIKGITHPVRWENITIIYDGDFIKVKQNTKSLGQYSLSEIGIPKITPKRSSGVAKIFLLLFLKDELQPSQQDILVSSNTNNHKNKSNLSKILCSAFGTNADPIKIDLETRLYAPIFRATYGGNLKLNEYRSGRKLYEETDLEQDSLD